MHKRLTIRLSTAQRAFTLIETVIAAAIFGAVLLGAVGVLAFTMRSISETRSQMYAHRIAETTLETVRNLSWAELEAQPAEQSFDATKPLVQLFGKQVNPGATQGGDFDGSQFNATGKLYIGPVAGNSNLRRVTVEISHATRSRRGGIAKTNLVTYISKDGIDRR